MTINKKISLSAILLAGTAWGCSSLFVKTLSAMGIPAFQTATIRFITSGIIMFLFVMIKDPGILKIKLNDLWIFLGSGLIGVFLTGIAYFQSMILSGVSVACILMYTSPIFVIIMSVLFFKERITSKKILAIILSVTGCLFVSGIFNSNVNKSIPGLLFGLLSGISYASFSIFGVFATKKYSPMTLTAYSMILSGILGLFTLDYKLIIPIAAASPSFILFVFTMGFCVSIIPYGLYSVGLKGVEPSTASVLSAIELVVASIIGIAVYKENLSIIIILGIVLVLSSIVILSKK